MLATPADSGRCPASSAASKSSEASIAARCSHISETDHRPDSRVYFRRPDVPGRLLALNFSRSFRRLGLRFARNCEFSCWRGAGTCKIWQAEPGATLLPEILAFNFFFGDLTDGRRKRGDLVPESGIAQGKARIPPGPGHVQVLGLGCKNTAKRGVRSGGGGAEITAAVVPDPGAISEDDQQMIRALAGNPMVDLFANPLRPGSLRRGQQDKPARCVKRGPDAGPQSRAGSQAGLVPEHLHGAAAVPWLRQLLQAPLQSFRKPPIAVMGIGDKGVIGLIGALPACRAGSGIRSRNIHVRSPPRGSRSLNAERDTSRTRPVA